MTQSRQRTGLLGERIAARYLLRNGYELVSHRFRSGHRDVDLIMRLGNEVVFVEVKCRRGSEFGTPVEAVTHRKQRELTKSALVWLSRNSSVKMTCRFDVIGVLIIGQNVRIRHVQDAFPVATG